MAASTSKQLGTVLVIGGGGFLGRHIIMKLIETKTTSKIVVLDITAPHEQITGVVYVLGSITSRDDVYNILQEHTPKVIFHTVSPNPLLENKKLFYSVNVGGTENLLKCIEEVGCVKALVYTSSSSVVHNIHTDLINAIEDLPLRFEPAQKVYYSHTKAVAEDMVLSANGKHGLLTTAIRPASLFGEGDFLLTPNMTELGGKNIIIGSGKNKFDFTYVGNNAYGQVLAAAALIRESTLDASIPPESRVAGEAFVITNDEPYPFWDFARDLAIGAGFAIDRTKARYLPKPYLMVVVGFWEWIVKIFSVGRRQPFMTRRKILPTTLERTFDISKAKKRLRYRPQVDMGEAIERTANWWKSQQVIAEKRKLMPIK